MQKITPYLWFDNKAEEAVNFYTSLFKDSEIDRIQKYPEQIPEMNDKRSLRPDGLKVLNATFELAGQKFMALDGGPQFKFTPAISFFVSCETEEEINNLWEKLSEGGNVMMEFQKYPFSEKYGWLSDKYGVSWQLFLTKTGQKINPSLMFVGDKAGKAEEAMKFYSSLFPNSEIVETSRYEKGEPDTEGYIKYALFKLAGQEFSAMDSSGPHAFSFNEAVSLYVDCADQVEVDDLWNKLTSGGGEESMCGWLKDKYGVSWQIIPKQLSDFMTSPDKERSGRVMQTMLQMKKIDIAKLQEAYNQRSEK